MGLLAFSGYPSFSKIVASVALTFFAYLGFNVITFAAGDLREPSARPAPGDVPALGITSAVYVLIAIGVFGTLTVAEVTRYGETAIAEAARPALGRRRIHRDGRRRASVDGRRDQRDAVRLLELDGDAGRRKGCFPRSSAAGRGWAPRPGCTSPAALVLVVANLVNLSAIASVGSAVALMIFLLVGIAGYRRRADTGSKTPIVVTAIAITAAVLAFFAVDTWQNAPETFAAILAILLFAALLDRWTRAGHHRTPAATSVGPAAGT